MVPGCGICFTSPFWHLGFLKFWKFVYPWTIQCHILQELTPYNGVIFVKQIFLQLVKKLFILCGTQGYHVYKCPPPVPLMSQINSIHALPWYYFKIHFNIIFPSVPRFPGWSSSFVFPHQNTAYISIVPHTAWLTHFITQILCKFSLMWQSYISCYRYLSWRHLSHVSC